LQHDGGRKGPRGCVVVVVGERDEHVGVDGAALGRLQAAALHARPERPAFAEGARAAGIDTFGWHSGAAVGDVNGDGRPDLYVTSYADMNAPVPGAATGFPGNFRPVRDRLYLNLGPDGKGRQGSVFLFRKPGIHDS
jgi:hypothetical protein